MAISAGTESAGNGPASGAPPTTVGARSPGAPGPSRCTGVPAPSAEQIWDKMLAHLREHSPTAFRDWFADIVPLGLADGAIELRVASSLHRDHLRNECASAFHDAARSVTGHLLAVRFITAAEAFAPKPLAPSRVVVVEPSEYRAEHRADGSPRSERESRPTADRGLTPTQDPHVALGFADSLARYESVRVNPDCSFETFVTGPNNRLAHAAAVSVSTNPGRSYNPFFVHGGVGLGKTHLLQAVCLAVASAMPGAVMYYTSCEGFMNQLFESIKGGKMAEFRHRYRDVDVLIIDDIHFLSKRDQSQEEFFNTFNTLHQAGKQIILSSDAPPEAIPELEDRLVSRFKWGLVAKIEPPDFETRIRILKTKAKLRGMVLPDNVAEAIAACVDTNIRELEGAITRLHVVASFEKAEITFEFAQKALADIIRVVPSEPTIQDIMAAVADYFQLKVTDMQGKQRHRSVTMPRHVCMSLARKCTRLSLEEIGGFFGGRDHTTVLHANKAIEAKMAGDPDFAMVIKGLEDRLLRNPRAAFASPRVAG